MRLKRKAAFLAASVMAVGLSVFAVNAAEATTGRKPTIVLVHGAFADASGFTEVSRRLVARGDPVRAAANPLRGVASDAAYVRALLDRIDGPIVLVGHSYGGSVISAVGDRDVRALVYLAAYVPDTGETAAELTGRFPGSTVTDALRPVPLPDGGTDLYIDPALFNERFAGDLPGRQASLLAVAQRPVTAAALNEPAAGTPAWRTIPSYDLISGGDLIIPPVARPQRRRNDRRVTPRLRCPRRAQSRRLVVSVWRGALEPLVNHPDAHECDLHVARRRHRRPAPNRHRRAHRRVHRDSRMADLPVRRAATGQGAGVRGQQAGGAAGA
jgi:pimeloyl-ACP methyl ester carboxylesterase